MKKGMFQKAGLIITEPSKFFKALDEKSVKSAFYYSIVLGLLAAVLEIGVGLLVSNSLYSGGLWVYTLAARAVSILMLNFAAAGILHLLIMAFGGKEGYSKTYQLLIYSMTPSYLLGWIPYVSILSPIWTFVLLVISTMRMQKMSKAKAVWLYVIVYMLIILFAAVLAVGIAYSTLNPLNVTASA